MSPAKLACDFLDFQLRTPFVLASGIIGTINGFLVIIRVLIIIGIWSGIPMST